MMDQKGAKSNGSQFSGLSKEKTSEKDQSKNGTTLPIKLPSMQGTKTTKSNVHQSKVSTKRGKTNKNVSLVSIKSRRSVGFNSAGTAEKTVEAENTVAVDKRKINLRPALLPRNLKSRSGSSYCLVDNRRSFGPEYHPDVPSKKKTASKIGKVFRNNKSGLTQAKENIESPKNDSTLGVTENAVDVTPLKKLQTRAQATSRKTAQTPNRNSSRFGLLSAAVSTVAGNGVQTRANERLKSVDNRPRLGVLSTGTKTLGRFVSGSIPQAHDKSGSRKSHSDKEIICSDSRKLSESCVSDQGQISAFVSLPDDGFRAGQDRRDKSTEQLRDLGKPRVRKDTDQIETHDKHRSGIDWSDSNQGKLTDDVQTSSPRKPCIYEDSEFQLRDLISGDSTGEHFKQALDDTCEQVGDSKLSITKVSDSLDGSRGSIKPTHHESQTLNECSMSASVDSSQSNCLHDETGRFTKQASHTLSRKFTWFKDERADLEETEEACLEIEDLSLNVDTNKNNISFKSTRRGGKLARKRQPLTERAFVKDGNITRKISTSGAVNSTSRPRRGGKAIPILSKYSAEGVDSNTCFNHTEKRTAEPGTSKKVTGVNSEDKELSGLKNPSKLNTDSGLAVKTRTDSFAVSHSPPGERRLHSHIQQHDLELEADTLSENLGSISSQLSGRVDWSDVDFSPYYYNSETEVDSPPQRREVDIGRKREENNYEQAGSGFSPRETIDSYPSHKKGKGIEVGRIYSGKASVRCVGTGKSTAVNHSTSQETTRRRCRDESVHTNSFSATNSQVQSSIDEHSSEGRQTASSPSSSSSASPGSSSAANYSQCSCGSRPTCTDLGLSRKCAECGTGNGPLEDVRQRLSSGAASGICDTDSDVSSVDLVRSVSHTFHPKNGYDSRLSGANVVNVVDHDQNKHYSGEDLQQLSISSDISATDTGCSNYSSSGLGHSPASSRQSRRRQRRIDRSRPTNHATGIGDKSGAHVFEGNIQSTGVGPRRNNVKYVPVNSVSTTTEHCYECGECLSIQTDDQDQVRYLFLSNINEQCDAATCSTRSCIGESPVNYAFDISASSNGEGCMTDAGKTLTNMTDNKARLGSARQAAEKLRSGSESQAACSKQPGVTAKNRSPSARATTSRSAGTTTHDAATVPRARGTNAEVPVTCKCRERAAEIKLSKLKKVNECRNNCAGNDRSGSRSRSQSAASASSRDSESRQKKASCAANREKRTDRNSMDARPARKLASSRAGAGIKEITSPRSGKLTSTSERTDIGVQDRTMSKQSAVKPVDGQGRLKITRPRSGGHKPDPRVRAAKEGSSTDRSDVSSSSCAARKSPSPREKSAEPSKDTVRTKGLLVKGDKTEPSSNKPTVKVSSRNDALRVKATGGTRNTTTGGKKVSPRAESSQSGNSQPSDRAQSPGDAQKSVPRYCSGSTVSSRNKSVRLAKTGSPRETGVANNAERDQSVSDTSVAGKSYSSRKSIPGTQNCKISSAKPSRIINKSKCSKNSSASNTKREDAGRVCDSIDLLTASPAADEIQNSNSNCDSVSDAAIKTSDKLPVIETPGDRGLSEERGSEDSLGLDVYPEEFGDSKDGADKGDSVFARGFINRSVDSSPEHGLAKSRGKGLSSQGTNREARYAGHPAATGKKLEQKRQSKVTARSKASGTSAGISRQSTLSNGTSDDVDPQNRDAHEGTAVTSPVSSKSKCVLGKRKTDGVRTGKTLSSESASGDIETSDNRHGKVTATKQFILNSGLQKDNSSGQRASCIPKPSKGSALKGVTPHGTQSHPDSSRTPSVVAGDGGDTDSAQVRSGKILVLFVSGCLTCKFL